MRGLLIYCREDYEKNRSFAAWLMKEFAGRGISIDILQKEELCAGRLDFAEYDFAVNRTRAYELALLLELGGLRVYNNSEITLLGNNKLAGYRYAQRRGFAFAEVLLPPFPLLEKEPFSTEKKGVQEKRESFWGEDGMGFAKEENTSECWEASFFSGNKKILAKPIYGHGGQGIYFWESPSDWRLENVNQVFLPDIVGDIRFYILQNRVHMAVLRRSQNGVTSNFSTGGSVERYCYDALEEALVQKFIGELTIDYAGVDFLLGKNGELMFNEIEDVAGSRMLSHMGINDIVPLWVENIAQEQERLRGRRQ